MRKMNQFILCALALILFSSFSESTLTANGELSILISDDIEATLERNMLDSIVFIEEEEEFILGYDPYLYLPYWFNAYEGMELDLNDIEYIELDEECF